MIGLVSRMRWVALTAAVLLLWCHGLEAPAHGTAAMAPHAARAASVELTAPAPDPVPILPDLNCCVDGAGTMLQAASLTRAPAPALPVLVALLSVALGLAAQRRSVRRTPHPATPHRSGLHQRAVLFRI